MAKLCHMMKSTGIKKRYREKGVNYTHNVHKVDVCAPPLQKPGQSVCAYGLTSWGFMVKITAPRRQEGFT